MTHEDTRSPLSLMASRTTSETPGNGRRYPEELKDLAFQLWAFRFSRNAADAARELLREWNDVEWGQKPDEATFCRLVAKWAAADQWAAKVRAAIAAVAPDIDTQIITNNIHNAYQASVIMGKIFRRELPPAEVRNYAYAAQIAFNAAGYEAASMPERVKQVTDRREDAFNPAVLASLSPDELAERADRIRRGLPLDDLPEIGATATAGERSDVPSPGEPIDAEIGPIRAPNADHRVARTSGRPRQSRIRARLRLLRP